MRIAHIHLSDVREGISGAVRTLMEEQKRQGDQPALFSLHHQTKETDVYSLLNPQDPWKQSMEMFEQHEGLTGLSASAVLELWRQPQFQQADVVHLHVTAAAYFSYMLLPSLAAKPLVWSIYEAQPYTAGCYHTVMCQRWLQQQCRECPLTPKEKQPRQEELFLLKKSIYALTPFAAVTSNPWLTSQVKQSILSSRLAAEIPLAIDPAFFRRVDRQGARKHLDIPTNAFVMAFVSPGGLSHPLYGGNVVRQLLAQWKQNNQNVVLLQLGSGEKEEPLPLPFSTKVIPYGLPPEQRSAIFQTADVFLQLSPHDAVGTNMTEAAASGVPAVAFPVAAGTQVRHLETGYLVSSNSVDEVLKGLLFLRSKQEFSRQLGQQAVRRVWQRQQAADVAKEYRNLYERVQKEGGRVWPTAVTAQIVPEIPKEGLTIEALWENTGIRQRVDQALSQGTEALWTELEACWSGYAKEREWERGVFVDLYLLYVMSRARQPMQPMLLIEIIDRWIRHRQLPARCGKFSPTEKLAVQAWTKVLRQTLEQFFRATPPEFFSHLTQYQQGRLIDLWRALFFNDFATPYLEDEMHQESRRQVEATTSPQRLYPDLLIRSMYTPYPPENVKLDMVRLLKKDVPMALQVILAFWLANVPYFDGDEKRQRIMRRNTTAFLESAMQDPETLPQPFYNGIVEHFVPNFWRAAYLGGNLVKEISLFGDFLHQQMQRFYPQFVERIEPKSLSGERRLRIGYVSSNFCHQAVSYYMANRIFCADRQRFETFVFSLEKRHDSMTDHIKAHSDRFMTFNDFRNLAGMAETIKRSELDILIFADIGMDQITYQLGAMRLAPVQCVLVGHGVTTGLPTMDYYVSGDFESPKAQRHYREQLVRLPNLGAAQLPPPFPATGKLTRQSFGFPEDAVLLVSCANGIKHGPERDELLVRILQQAPQAVIVLKPFMNPDLVQPQWMRRVQEAARRGGVEDRFRIIPPLAQGKDLMDFLAMADIQLDTYPYGGWTTNMEAVYSGLAVVTQEGELARSRWGAHILRALGVSAGIAKNEGEYVRQAVELVNDKALRDQVRQQIRSRAKEVLFNGEAAQPAYEAELMRIQTQALKNWSQVVQA